MDLFLNPELLRNEELKGDDIEWLKYIWTAARDTSGIYARIFMDTLPKALCDTWIYRNFDMRLQYYRDVEKFIVEFEEVEYEKEYYIHLADNFLDTVNCRIRTRFLETGHELLLPYTKPDLLSQEMCQDLKIELDEVLNVLQGELQLSKEDTSNIAEIKSSIEEIQEDLKMDWYKKAQFRKRLVMSYLLLRLAIRYMNSASL